MDYLVRAIKKIKPTAEFVFSNNDYSTIQWHILEGDAPTQAEIDAAIEAIKQEEIQAEAEAKIAKQAILDRLGLTEDDLRIVLG